MKLNNLNKNIILKNKLQEITKLKKNKQYFEAYKKLTELIDYINQKFTYANYNIKLDFPSHLKASKIYFEKDKILFNYMLSLNSEYNTITDEKCKYSDIEYLCLFIENIYTYMLNNYGEFI